MAANNGILELQEPSLGPSGGQPLQCFTKISSEVGLSSVTTLIVGSQAAVVVDPPFLVPDAKAVVEFIKSKTDLPVVAVFTSHHHPDHYFSANPILDAFPGSRFYAHEYVRAGIDREYDEKVVYWPKVGHFLGGCRGAAG
jgi:glyoxylase-like metal-dependent hydrolase (beta-lactamase superfamily II)